MRSVILFLLCVHVALGHYKRLLHTTSIERQIASGIRLIGVQEPIDEYHKERFGPRQSNTSLSFSNLNSSSCEYIPRSRFSKLKPSGSTLSKHSFPPTSSGSISLRPSTSNQRSTKNVPFGQRSLKAASVRQQPLKPATSNQRLLNPPASDRRSSQPKTFKSRSLRPSSSNQRSFNRAPPVQRLSKPATPTQRRMKAAVPVHGSSQPSTSGNRAMQSRNSNQRRDNVDNFQQIARFTDDAPTTSRHYKPSKLLPVSPARRSLTTRKRMNRGREREEGLEFSAGAQVNTTKAPLVPRRPTRGGRIAERRNQQRQMPAQGGKKSAKSTEVQPCAEPDSKKEQIQV